MPQSHGAEQINWQEQNLGVITKQLQQMSNDTRVPSEYRDGALTVLSSIFSTQALQGCLPSAISEAQGGSQARGATATSGAGGGGSYGGGNTSEKR